MKIDFSNLKSKNQTIGTPVIANSYVDIKFNVKKADIKIQKKLFSIRQSNKEVFSNLIQDLQLPMPRRAARDDAAARLAHELEGTLGRIAEMVTKVVSRKK